MRMFFRRDNCRCLLAVAIICGGLAVARAGTIYVAPDADGTGDGSSWASPKTLAAGFDAARDTDEIWLKTGTYAMGGASLSTGYAFALRGGFVGTESEADERNPDVRSTISGARQINLSAASGTIILDGLDIAGSTTRGINKSGAADLHVRNSAIRDNTATTATYGLGFYGGNKSAQTLVFENVQFLRNRIAAGFAGSTSSSVNPSGAAINVDAASVLALTNCLFVGNGLDPSYVSNIPQPGREQASVVCANNAPVAAYNCRFLGNRIGGQGGNGGHIVYLRSNCNGSSFDHCLFAGNVLVANDSSSPLTCGGALTVKSSNVGNAVTLNHCTIAYNYGAAAVCAGLNVYTGTATIRNSIIFGNIVGDDSAVGSDLYLGSANAVINVDSSLISGCEEPYVCRANASASLMLGRALIYGDPLFATSYSSFVASITGEGGVFDATALDVHLRSKAGRWDGSDWVKDGATSLAIDAGETTADFSNEPLPNGSCVNLGCYGNTLEASKTSLKPIYVSPDADGTGDGRSWDSPTTLAAAFASARNNDEIWLKTGTYVMGGAALSTRYAFALRGGFVGTESDAEERNPDARSTISGAKGISYAAGSGTNLVDGIDIANSTERGIYKGAQASALRVVNSTIRDNASTSATYGLGVYAGSQSTQTLVFENVQFLRNRIDASFAGSTAINPSGLAINVDAAAVLALTNCLFVGNGLDPSYVSNVPQPTRDQAAIVCANNAPVAAYNCRFLGNRIGGQGGNGGHIVYLRSNCNGSSFDHCLFSGNVLVANDSSSPLTCGGALTIKCYSGNAVALNQCTIAYNLGAFAVCAGLNVHTGTARIRNSILFGNIARNDKGIGADLYLGSVNAAVDIDNSLISSSDVPSICKTFASATLTVGDAMVYKNPRFVTSSSDFVANVSGNDVVIDGQKVSPWNATLPASFDAETFDLHLRSKAGRWSGSGWVKDFVTSPAIDAGEAASDYSNEPLPNGSCVNLGFYGNTLWASKTYSGGLIFLVH